MSTPIWQQIRQTLGGEIESGRFVPGDKLPTEAALSQRFDVNRHTVRRALAEMQNDGLVHSRRGAGVFVTGKALTYRVGPRTRFSQNLAESGHVGDREIVRLETLPATAAEAERLELPLGSQVHLVDAVGIIDGAPAFFSQAVFPAEPLGAFPEAMQETRSITRALEACGIENYRRAWTRLRAERADGTLARHLRIADGAPVLSTRALNLSEDGWPVEYSRTTFCADRVELLIEDQVS